MLYVGSGASVYVRPKPYPAGLARSASYPGTQQVMGISADTSKPGTAFVIDVAMVFKTDNGGNSWSDIGGNLRALAPGSLISIAVCRISGQTAVAVGSETGTFVAMGPGFSNWTRLGDRLPRVGVYQLDYSAADRVLVAATLGRGAWLLALDPQHSVTVSSRARGRDPL